MNMFARFDENPAMTLQDIKETKCYGRTHTRTDRRTTWKQHTHHKQSLRGYKKSFITSRPGYASPKIGSKYSCIDQSFGYSECHGDKLKLTHLITGPLSAVGNMSGYRCVSDCRSRGHEFDPGPVPYFRGDWSWNNFYGHSPPFRWFIQEGLLSVTSECMCTNYWLTACSSLPRKKCG